MKNRKGKVERVRRIYEAYRRKYFADGSVPRFKDIVFVFQKIDGCSGMVRFVDGEAFLTLHPLLWLNASLMRQVILHEMIHIKLGPRYWHGKRFWAEAERIHAAGAYREYFG